MIEAPRTSKSTAYGARLQRDHTQSIRWQARWDSGAYTKPSFTDNDQCGLGITSTLEFTV
jgi:hypothetical protein